VTGGGWNDAEFERLFRAHFAGIYRVLFRIVGSRQEAEDLAQEVFLRCYQVWDPSAHPVRPWLYRVAMNLAFNERRDRRRRDVRNDKAGRIETAIGDPPDPDPSEAIAREEEREAVRRTLDTLPPRQAQILLLRHAGLSYREVAEALEVVPASVGTLLARAEAAFEEAHRSGAGRASRAAAAAQKKEGHHGV